MRRRSLEVVVVMHADDIGNRINLLKYKYEAYNTQIEVTELAGQYFIEIWKL